MSERSPATPIHILFVCWGNICRSPTAEGILRRQLAETGLSHLVEVESAGASNEHAGQRPDRRAIAEADARGIDLRDIRARRLSRDDWSRFDLILVADDLVERTLARQAPDAAARAKLHRMTAFGPDAETYREVPDPYYGGADGFELVYEVLERACAGLLDRVRLEGSQAG